jgi:DNA-binding IclR family transcriptional regulator
MPADRERNETGQFVVQRDSEDLLESMAPGEPHTASELAEVLDWPRRSVFDRLATLHEDDRVDKKQVNARTVIWTRPEQDDQP